MKTKTKTKMKRRTRWFRIEAYVKVVGQSIDGSEPGCVAVSMAVDSTIKDAIGHRRYVHGNTVEIDDSIFPLVTRGHP